MIKVQKILQKKKRPDSQGALLNSMAKNRSVMLRSKNRNQTSSIPFIEEAVEAASDTADLEDTLPANFST